MLEVPAVVSQAVAVLAHSHRNDSVKCLAPPFHLQCCLTSQGPNGVGDWKQSLACFGTLCMGQSQGQNATVGHLLGLITLDQPMPTCCSHGARPEVLLNDADLFQSPFQSHENKAINTQPGLPTPLPPQAQIRAAQVTSSHRDEETVITVIYFPEAAY